MYECTECHVTFKTPKHYVVRRKDYNLETTGCPACGGDYRELTTCGMCGHESICLREYKDKKICTECAVFLGLIGED